MLRKSQVHSPCRVFPPAVTQWRRDKRDTNCSLGNSVYPCSCVCSFLSSRSQNSQSSLMCLSAVRMRYIFKSVGIRHSVCLTSNCQFIIIAKCLGFEATETCCQKKASAHLSSVLRGSIEFEQNVQWLSWFSSVMRSVHTTHLSKYSHKRKQQNKAQVQSEIYSNKEEGRR